MQIVKKLILKRFSLNLTLKTIGINKSSYYSNLKSSLTKQEQDKLNLKLKDVVTSILEKHSSYGYRRIYEELKRQGIVVNHKKLLPLLKKWGLTIYRRVKKRSLSGVEKILCFLGSKVNLVKRLSDEERKVFGRVIFTDFTEIVYNLGKNKLYLVPFMEYSSRKVIGFAVSENPNTETVLEALKIGAAYLIKMGVDISKTIFHSDQGSVFKSYDYVKYVVGNLKANLSYSRKAAPGDNACQESFFGRFKDDNKQIFFEETDRQKVILEIRDRIEYYNGERFHSAHDNKLSPEEYIKNIFKKTKLI